MWTQSVAKELSLLLDLKSLSYSKDTSNMFEENTADRRHNACLHTHLGERHAVSALEKQLQLLVVCESAATCDFVNITADLDLAL